MKKNRIPRRTFLRGAGGIALSLPLLEIMLQDLALGATAPKRIMFIYIPNGANMPTWIPAQTGTNIAMSPTLMPLESIKSKLLVMSGLNLTRSLGQGGGDHGRGGGTYLTQARISQGSARAGISIDHAIAQKIGADTKMRLLKLGMENVGGEDSWGTNAYTRNLSWISATQPDPKEINPATVFNQLFGSGFPGQTTTPQEDTDTTKRKLYRKSVLDAVLADANDLRAKLGKTDQEKLDEYLNSIREVERQVSSGTIGTPIMAACTPMTSPGNSNDYRERMKAMLDLAVLGFSCDATRVATMSFGDEGSGRTYDFLGVRNPHHQISHYLTGTDDAQGGDQSADAVARRRADLAIINKYHVEQLAYLLQKMNSITEGSGTMLDNSIIVYGASLSDSHAHSSDNLPLLMAGGSGFITGNRHVNFGSRNITELFVWLMQQYGVNPASFGGSSTALTNIKV